MAATVDIDSLDSMRASHALIMGYSVSRSAVISNIPVEDNATVGDLLVLAEEALIVLTGPRGSACPGLAVPSYLDQFSYEVVDPYTVKASISYKGFPALQLEFSSTISQVETNMDRFGNLITVSYSYPPNYLLDPRKAVFCAGPPRQPVKQGGLVTRPHPEKVFAIKFVVTSGLASVTALTNLEGQVNSNVWTVGSIVGRPRTWLAERVRALSKDGGFSYEMDCAFHYRSQTWDPLVSFINPDDGKPPPDITYNRKKHNWQDQYGNVAAYSPQVPYQSTFPSISSGAN